MKQSDKFLAERKRLEQKEEALFYEHQDFKRLTEESENMLFEIQHFQPQLENCFAGSQQMHSIESLYSESLSQSKQAFFEIEQTRDELQQERQYCKDEIETIQKNYHQTLQQEENQSQKGIEKW